MALFESYSEPCFTHFWLLLHRLSDGVVHFLVLGALRLFFRGRISLLDKLASALYRSPTCVFEIASLAVLLLFQLALSGLVLLAGAASIEGFSEIFQVRQRIGLLSITARASRTTHIFRTHVVLLCKDVMNLNGIRKKALVEAFSECHSICFIR